MRSIRFLLTTVVAALTPAGLAGAAQLSVAAPEAVEASAEAPAAQQDGATAEATIVQGSAIVVHSPSGTKAWSTSGQTPTVTALAPGSWRVRLPGITALGGAVVVTPANAVAAALCAIDAVGLHNGATAITLHCQGNGNQPGAAFNLTYTSRRVAGATAWWNASEPTNTSLYAPKPAFNPTAGGAVTASSATSTSDLRATFAGLVPTSPSDVLVTGWGPGRPSCAVHGYSSAPAGFTWVSRCYDNNLLPTLVKTSNYYVPGSVLPTTAGKWVKTRVTMYKYSPVLPPVPVITTPTGNTGVITATYVDRGVTRLTVAGGATNKPGVTHVRAEGWMMGIRCSSTAEDSGANEIITVKCFDAFGFAFDSAFSLHYYTPN